MYERYRIRPRSPLAQAGAFLDATRRLGLAGQRRDRLLCARHDLSPAQWYCLDALHQAGALGMNDLARQSRISRSTATRLVDLLEKKNLARRRPGRSDRRRIEVQMTSKGERLHEEIEEELRRASREILALLSPTDRVPALEGLEVLATVTARWLDRQEARGEAADPDEESAP